MLLGYRGKPITGKEQLDAYVPKIGGAPLWLSEPYTNSLTCSTCQNPLALVLQTHAPLDKIPKTDNRILYIFACLNQKCSSTSSGWLVLRSQSPVIEAVEPPKKVEPIKEKKAEVKPKSGGWDVDDWGGNQETTVDDLEALLEKRSASASASSAQKTKKSGQASKQIVTPSFSTTESKSENSLLKEYYFEYEEEPPEAIYKKKLDQNYKNVRPAETDATEVWNEDYESSSPDDKQFYKFLKRIDRSPQQCLRYSFGGEPLWMTVPTEEQSEGGNCGECGAKRVFELQLLPTLINYLEEIKTGGRPMQYGVVAVYSCSKSCPLDNRFAQEAVTLQQERY